jgi:xanthine dehydrogenase accessory factor
VTSKVQLLKAFLAAEAHVALVEVTETKGSTPRETGAFMLVSPTAILGTIGGGQLEYIAIAKARLMLAGGRETVILDVPLGPEIGQCCGGRVAVTLREAGAPLRSALVARAETEDAALPAIYLFGSGHVGQALACALALLPAHIVVVETRADALNGMPDGVETRLIAMPESLVQTAPAGAAFAVLTHDHALDFMIVAEALKRHDAAYVGMIGSKTKKATFRSWFINNAGGSQSAFSRLVSPIGGDRVKDKRPAVIAALAAAEIMTALVAHAAETAETGNSRRTVLVGG